ncbi:hypothetical protein AB0M43_37515 [Longispora sp. NPDC051575]|uniref:hypothetical protein n=1 Tax=Longispora sp. NPDC051575 TaxID=3154943 RepID=UPI003424BB45
MAEDNGPSLDSRALFAQLAKMIRADDPQQLRNNADAWLTVSRALHERAATVRREADELAHSWPDATGAAIVAALRTHASSLEREAGTYQHNHGMVTSAAAALTEAQSKLAAIENDPSTTEAKAAAAQGIITALDGDYQTSHTRIQNPQFGAEKYGNERAVDDGAHPDWTGTDPGGAPGQPAPLSPAAGPGQGPSGSGSGEQGTPLRVEPPNERPPGTPEPSPVEGSGSGLASGGGPGGFGGTVSGGGSSGFGGFSVGPLPGSGGPAVGGLSPTDSAGSSGFGAGRGPGAGAQPIPGAGSGRPGPGGPGMPGVPGSGQGAGDSQSRRRASRAVGDWLAVDNHAAPAVLGGRRRASDDNSPEARLWEESERLFDGDDEQQPFDLLGVTSHAGPEPTDDVLEYIDDDSPDEKPDETGRDWRDGLTDTELTQWSTMSGVKLAPGPARD